MTTTLLQQKKLHHQRNLRQLQQHSMANDVYNNYRSKINNGRFPHSRLNQPVMTARMRKRRCFADKELEIAMEEQDKKPAIEIEPHHSHQKDYFERNNKDIHKPMPTFSHGAMDILRNAHAHDQKHLKSVTQQYFPVQLPFIPYFGTLPVITNPFVTHPIFLNGTLLQTRQFYDKKSDLRMVSESSKTIPKKKKYSSFSVDSIIGKR